MNMIPAPAHNFQRSGQHLKRLLGWLDNGDPVFERVSNNLETIHFLTAEPGWQVIQWCDEPGLSDEERMCRTAVIAWKIFEMSGLTYGDPTVVRTTWALPVTGDQLSWEHEHFWLLGPDGVVYQSEEVPLPFEQWLERRKQQLAEKQPEKPELKAAA
jgi:hypothetical protein